MTDGGGDGSECAGCFGGVGGVAFVDVVGMSEDLGLSMIIVVLMAETVVVAGVGEFVNGDVRCGG